MPRDFGKYRLTRRIATGGMAEIFLAHRVETPDEPLVIKRILSHLTEAEDFVSMFLDEARIAASLDHPNIVRINDIGQIEGRYFLAMEYIPGEDIRSIYNQAYRLQRSLPLSHSIQVVAGAARGLAYAHRATDMAGKSMQLVHRDVSPQNILVTYDGGVKVVDFGIAKAANKVAQTSAGVLKGKYSYMSPEQAMGEGIDHRTDLFALGIILYETTTGTRLFKRENELATLQAIIKCDYKPPHEVVYDYPDGLEEIVLKAITKDPDERYQDGDSFADDLDSFLKDSGLALGREKIGEFMTNLFEDKLEAESTLDAKGPRITRHPPNSVTSDYSQEVEVRPVLSEEDEQQEDIDGDGQPEPPLVEQRVVQARLDTDLATRKRLALKNLPPPGFAAERPEVPKIEVKAAESQDMVWNADAPDEAATIAVTHVYQPPEDPPAPSVAHRSHLFEPTDRIRQRKTSILEHKSVRSSEYEDETSDTFDPPGLGQRHRPSVFTAALVVVFGFALGLGVALFWALSHSPPSSKVTVLTEPGTDVYIDGELKALADAEGRAGPFTLPEGKNQVHVENLGLRFERERTLMVEANRTYEVEIRARLGFLNVRVSPWARVMIDGKTYGLTPLTPVALYEGRHEVILENPDLKARQKIVAEVSAGKEERLEVKLSRGRSSRNK